MNSYKILFGILSLFIMASCSRNIEYCITQFNTKHSSEKLSQITSKSYLYTLEQDSLGNSIAKDFLELIEYDIKKNSILGNIDISTYSSITNIDTSKVSLLGQMGLFNDDRVIFIIPFSEQLYKNIWITIFIKRKKFCKYLYYFKSPYRTTFPINVPSEDLRKIKIEKNRSNKFIDEYGIVLLDYDRFKYIKL